MASELLINLASSGHSTEADRTTVRQWLEVQRSKLPPDILRSVMSWRLTARALDSENATATTSSAAGSSFMKQSENLTPRHRTWSQVRYNTRSQSAAHSTSDRGPSASDASKAAANGSPHTDVDQSLLYDSAFSFYDAVDVANRLFGDCLKSKADGVILFALPMNDMTRLNDDLMALEWELDRVDDFGGPDTHPWYSASRLVLFVTQLIVNHEEIQRACVDAHNQTTKAKGKRHKTQLSDAWFKPPRRSSRLRLSGSQPTGRIGDRDTIQWDELAGVSTALLMTVLQNYRCT